MNENCYDGAKSGESTGNGENKLQERGEGLEHSSLDGGASSKVVWDREDGLWWDDEGEVEPWPEPVDGAALLDELEVTYGRFAVLPKWSGVVLALFSMHSHAFYLRDVTVYLGIESPEKRCGKTTLLTVLCGLVNRPVVAANISSPALYRVIEEKRPTLLIDEADTVLHRNRELRGILNAGYTRKTAYVIRALRGKKVKDAAKKPGKERDWSAYSCWCPKAIATIRHLPDTLADRCIVIPMERKTGRERCERVKHLDGLDLRRKCARFVAEHAKEIAEAQPKIPRALNDRVADVWEPLFALADLAGGRWPRRARQAAVSLSARAQEESPIVSLLVEVMMAFGDARSAVSNTAGGIHEKGRIFSRDLVARLSRQTDRPWANLKKGRKVTELWLAQQLRPYGVRPKTLWIGGEAAKGYSEEDFTEVFKRYVPKAALRAWIEEARESQQPMDPEDGPLDPG